MGRAAAETGLHQGPLQIHLHQVPPACTAQETVCSCNKVADSVQPLSYLSRRRPEAARVCAGSTRQGAESVPRSRSGPRSLIRASLERAAQVCPCAVQAAPGIWRPGCHTIGSSISMPAAPCMQLHKQLVHRSTATLCISAKRCQLQLLVCKALLGVAHSTQAEPSWVRCRATAGRIKRSSAAAGLHWAAR